MSARPTGAVAIGNFDGVHLGHRAVLDAARRLSDRAKGRTAALTFDPHPLRVLRPDTLPGLITTPSERTELLHGAGVDDVVTLTFDRTLASLEPDAFVTELLWPRLRPAWVVVGPNFAFGRGARGKPVDLARLGERLGFGVEVVPPVVAEGSPVSSSRIRERLSQADIAGARRLLGHAYTLRGTVVSGAGRGREMGVPTANLVPDPVKLLPPEGVYAAWARVPGDSWLPAAVDLGRRPTFESDGELRLEAYLLEGGRDLYGQPLDVALVRYVRPDRTFPDAHALEEAVRDDVAAIRAVLREDAPPG